MSDYITGLPENDAYTAWTRNPNRKFGNYFIDSEKHHSVFYVVNETNEIKLYSHVNFVLPYFAVTSEPTSSNATAYEVWEYMFTLRTPEGWVNGSAGITGVLLLIILGIIFVFAQPFVRERGYFEVSKTEYIK